MLRDALAEVGAHEAPSRRSVQAFLYPERHEVGRVCHLCEQEGWNELPKPSLYPRQHRELLRAVVAVRLGISYWRINLKALDAAYSIAFPNSTPINVNKKSKNLKM